MKVLIVEDEAILAINIQMDLSSLGYQVVGIADSAERALGIAEKDRPDIFLIDIVIQGNMNGIELAKLFANKYPESKIIYMTAHSDDATIENAMKTPHAGLLNKPFELYQLEHVLKQGKT